MTHNLVEKLIKRQEGKEVVVVGDDNGNNLVMIADKNAKVQ